MPVNPFIAALGDVFQGLSVDRANKRKLSLEEEERQQRLEDRKLAAEERVRLAQERKEATEWLTFTRGQELANMDARPVGDTERALAALETPPETFQLKRGEIPTDVGIGGPKQPPIGSRLGPDPFAPSPFRGAGAVAGIERENQRAPLRSQIAQAVNVPGLGKYTIPTRTEQFRKEGQGIASLLGLEVSDETAAAIGQNPAIASSLSQDSRAQAAALAATTKAASEYESKQRGAFAVLSRKGGPLAGKPFNSPEVQAFGNLESMLDMYKADLTISSRERNRASQMNRDVASQNIAIRQFLQSTTEAYERGTRGPSGLYSGGMPTANARKKATADGVALFGPEAVLRASGAISNPAYKYF